MFPHADAASPPLESISASIAVVVVLPLVPVTASHVRGEPKQPSWSASQDSSTSPHTGTPAAAAARSNGESGRQPGEVTTRSTAPGAVKLSRAASTLTVVIDSRADSPSLTTTVSRSASSASGRPSATVTFPPSRRMRRTAPGPETPAPATSTFDPKISDARLMAMSTPLLGSVRRARRVRPTS